MGRRVCPSDLGTRGDDGNRVVDSDESQRGRTMRPKDVGDPTDSFVTLGAPDGRRITVNRCG